MIIVRSLKTFFLKDRTITKTVFFAEEIMISKHCSVVTKPEVRKKYSFQGVTQLKDAEVISNVSSVKENITPQSVHLSEEMKTA